MTDPASTPPARDPVGWLNNQPYLLLTLTSLFWAGNIVLARHVGNHVPPITLTTIRWFGVFLILLPFAWPHLKRDWKILRAHLPMMLLLSAIGFAFNNAISYWAMQYTQALNALLIQSSGPLFVALWSLILFGVRLTGAQLAGIAISLIGVLTIILRGDFAALAGISFNKGDVMFGPNRAAPFFHLVPVFGSALAILLLGEQVRLFHLVGYALVLAGVVIASRRSSART